ncbi:hypothetical protein H6G80_06885 [Nostoc sp. FACHB-87]|uniref:hypothetical protein n=1 Tax=Nostocaceae TaxID=1162 RepID=UPI0016844BB0|nr:MULTISPECIES: hypothetical protein [Nostocaceae]MBD2453800.1 hypothetical protein [Nostoc sp. FACHB-87]MBD2475244.1 hypothetical protein [Anabaena sp. FACHB-83]
MKILPYDSFTVTAPEPLPIVVQRLSANIEPRQAFRFSRQHTLYQGTISDDGFQIMRIINYRNLFLPMIRGRFEAQPRQTLVHIQISVNNVVMAFLGLWLFIWCNTVSPITFTDETPHFVAALFVAMPILIVLIFWIAFWSEANRSRAELTKIIQGQV